MRSGPVPGDDELAGDPFPGITLPRPPVRRLLKFGELRYNAGVIDIFTLDSPDNLARRDTDL